MRTSDIVILIVDDEPDMLANLSFALRMSGFTVLEAGSGLAGLNILWQHEVSIVVTDLNMTPMSGYQFIETAQAQCRSTHFFVMSGYLDDNACNTLARMGVSGFFNKPFQIAALEEEILNQFKPKSIP